MNVSGNNYHEKYDAFLLISFGGPEGMDDVMPFLQNVLKGKNVPQQRLHEVAHHYEMFGGVSPINEQNRELLKTLEVAFAQRGMTLPIYWGNRNWHPLLEDTVRQMKRDGVKRAVAFVTSAYSSYSGCRQYLEDIERARLAVGCGAPQIEKIGAFYNHPLFIEVNAANLSAAISNFPSRLHDSVHVLFTAHSLPVAMASQCAYVEQLETTCRLVMDKTKLVSPWKLVYQSRSGRPSEPWLYPDVCDQIKELHKNGVDSILVAPIGFISDHMEVVYDLDNQAKQLCQSLGVNLVRVATPGVHPIFVRMISELTQARIAQISNSTASNFASFVFEACPNNCCLAAAVQAN